MAKQNEPNLKTAEEQKEEDQTKQNSPKVDQTNKEQKYTSIF